MMQSPSNYVDVTMSGLSPNEADLAYSRMEAWALLAGVKPYKGTRRHCLRQLANPRHRCGKHCHESAAWPSVLDHPELWRAQDGAFVLTAHNYGPMSADDRDLLANIAARTGAELIIDPDWSWYWPSATELVVLWGVAP